MSRFRRYAASSRAPGLRHVEFKSNKWHPAFTAPKRISAYLKEPETGLGAKAHNLSEMLPPGSSTVRDCEMGWYGSFHNGRSSTQLQVDLGESEADMRTRLLIHLIELDVADAAEINARCGA